MNKIPNHYTITADTLSPGERLTVTKNTIKTRKNLSFTANVDSLADGLLIIGHGYMQTNATWIEISDSEIAAYSYFSYSDPQKKLKAKAAHCLKISKFIAVSIDFDIATLCATVLITTAGGIFRTEVNGWYGADGEIFASFTSTEAKNCKLNWSCPDFARPIWLIGASYTGFGHAARWPYYLRRDGYLNLLAMGFPGMNGQRGIEEFRAVIDMGTPEFAIWALGMNNGDNPGEINPDYLTTVKEFIDICETRGIVPILSTIPNCPKVNNRHKNEWIRNSGCRYVDFNRAVGAHKDVAWYPGMLHTDNVHPGVKGAQALYAQILTDFPEIMQAIR